jgi:hypothetical protein
VLPCFKVRSSPIIQRLYTLFTQSNLPFCQIRSNVIQHLSYHVLHHSPEQIGTRVCFNITHLVDILAPNLVTTFHLLPALYLLLQYNNRTIRSLTQHLSPTQLNSNPHTRNYRNIQHPKHSTDSRFIKPD